MKLTGWQEELIEHAFKKEVPKEVAETSVAIFYGKKKVKVPKARIHLTDIGRTIQFTDHPMNQFIQYLIDKYGMNFGLLYFAAIQGKSPYRRTLRMQERIEREGKDG